MNNQQRIYTRTGGLIKHLEKYKAAFRVAALYCVFASLWILLSDYGIDLITDDTATLTTLQTAKGLLFIVLTTLLIFWLVYRSVKDIQRIQSYQHTLVETIPDLVWLKSPEGVYITCNTRFERFFGAKEAEIVGKTDYDFVDKTLADFFRENDQAAMVAGHPTINEETVTYADDGHQELLETIKTPMYDANGQLIGVLGVARDITERKQQEQKILHQAHFDDLTDLPNRFLSLYELEQRIHDARRNGGLIGVVVIDLDDFKKVNDTLGHETGDRLLIEVAQRFRANLREGDLLGRLGGDEFIILLNSLQDSESAGLKAAELIGCLRPSIHINERRLMLSASIGIALYPADGYSPAELLRNADSALHYAKATGRNTFSYFTRSMHHQATRHLLIEEQMYKAMQRGEFHLCYQPQIDLRSGTLRGFEALLRWDNPVLGTLSPNEFIPVAEHSGMIVPLGMFVVEEALKACTALRHSSGLPVTMAVNLSPRQFRDPNLITDILRHIERSELPASALELEITEGVLMSGYQHVTDALHQLSEYGITLAMDDFGSGYSSLSYLRDYPFDVVKIDQSFIRGIAEHCTDLELVNAAIAMAHSLGLSALAEGVETEEQLALLADHGCDTVQGFLFSHALPLPEALQWLQQHTADPRSAGN